MKVIIANFFARQIKNAFPKKVHFQGWQSIMNFLQEYQFHKNDSIGRKFLKIRFEEAKILKGKKFRIICYARLEKDHLFPILLYSKQELGSVSQKEIMVHFQNVKRELPEFF